jgi:hypothetical protein
MGGQACVFYGAAEFSRDLDLLVLADANSLNLLSHAMDQLEAPTIAVPRFEGQFLDRGHAIHFRCQRSDVKGLRIDVMSRLRRTDDFEQLWARRTKIEVEEVEVDMLALEDLVRAKKTQCDKDWPMIRRLVEQSYFLLPSQPNAEQLEFHLLELRTPDLLMDLAARFPEAADRAVARRPAIAPAVAGSVDEVSAALAAEEAAERAIDRAYWRPLREELESLRRAR